MTGSNEIRFASTRWSIVRAAADGPAETTGREALAVLYETYWKPIYAYCRRRGLPPEEAQDATQDFYGRLLERRDLERADPDRGRFRSYLLTCLQHFVTNRLRAQGAKKRGGGHRFLSLDGAAAESWQAHLQEGLSPEKSFERAWALTLMERTMDRLRRDYQKKGRDEVFEALKPVLTADQGAVPYADLATAQKTSPDAIKVAVHKMRQRYRELLRREIAETVCSAEGVDAEIRELFAALS